jgi:hypothetical protein
MEVFTVFRATGDEAGCTVYDLLGVAKTALGASVIINDQFDDREARHDLIHVGMSADNNYSFFGPRENTRPKCNRGEFGGYIVERTERHD